MGETNEQQLVEETIDALHAWGRSIDATIEEGSRGMGWFAVAATLSVGALFCPGGWWWLWLVGALPVLAYAVACAIVTRRARRAMVRAEARYRDLLQRSVLR